MDYYNVTVVIPSLDPDEKLMNLILELKDNGFDDIIVINDGSSAEHRKYFPDPEEYPFCTVLTHRRNRGKGAALKTAFRFFAENRKGREGVVTIDGDGQHLTKDIVNCTKRMVEENKIILGCRDFSHPFVPKRSRFGNKMTSLVFRLLCGIKISDTQTGLRAIPARYIDDFINIKGSRYEYETNMLLEFKKMHIDYIEQPIDTVYIEDNKASHFRPVVDSFRIYKLILVFVFSSLFSMGVEVLMFYFLLQFLFKGELAVLEATILSRIVSSIVNFSLNRSQVFGKQCKLGRSLFRYTLLAIPLMITSAVCIEALSTLMGASQPILKTLIKMLVDTILFFVSFRIQQSWVFAPEKCIDEQDAPLKPRKKLTAGRIIRRVFGCLGTFLLYVFIAVFTLVSVLAHGPSTTIRDALVLSAMQASATKWVPGLFLSDEEVKQIVDNSYVDEKLTIDMDDYVDSNEGDEEGDDGYIEGMKYMVKSYDNFKAYILLIKDPSRVYVGTSSNNFASASAGKRIFDFVGDEKCLAAINAGEFEDQGGHGSGARPVGLTYSKGKCVWNDGAKKSFIGIDKNNRLVVKSSMTKAEAEKLGIRDSVCFQIGNVLIDTNENGVNLHYRSYNSGAAQRTGIGQRADGTIIFAVTDGRTASSIGATYNDMIDIMKDCGAVTAGMLDGGSSSMMYYENFYQKYNIDENTLDKYQKQGLCNRYKAFSTPRRIPTYFCVSR